jgi:hypothetical protein
MEKPTLTFRLEPDLAAVLDDQAKTAGRARSAHLAAIIESHLCGNGNGRAAPPSDDLLRRQDQMLQALRAISAETNTLTQIVAQKEREASADFAELAKQIDQLRTDIATLFGAALEKFAGVEPNEAVAFTQKFMYAGRGGRA